MFVWSLFIRFAEVWPNVELVHLVLAKPESIVQLMLAVRLVAPYSIPICNRRHSEIFIGLKSNVLLKFRAFTQLRRLLVATIHQHHPGVQL